MRLFFSKLFHKCIVFSCRTFSNKIFFEFNYRLCKRDPHQLFMRLEGQAQDFVVETKVRLLDLLHNRNTNNLAEIFLTGWYLDINIQ